MKCGKGMNNFFFDIMQRAFKNKWGDISSKKGPEITHLLNLKRNISWKPFYKQIFWESLFKLNKPTMCSDGKSDIKSGSESVKIYWLLPHMFLVIPLRIHWKFLFGNVILCSALRLWVGYSILSILKFHLFPYNEWL